MTQFKKIYLERTMCYGDCPVYKLFITSKGNVQLNKDHYLSDEVEIFKWKIDLNAISELNEVLRKYGYFKLKKKEPTYWQTDGPFCITQVEFEDGSKRKIEHYLGDDAYPKRLITIENWIDKIVGVMDY